MGKVITEFTGEYEFLKNTYLAPISIGHQHYMCVESAYQAIRCGDANAGFAFAGMPGDTAREFGLTVEEKPDWDSVKWMWLYRLTLEKFKQNYQLCERLLSTGDAEIRDDFLGDILMRVRLELTPKLAVTI